MASRKLGAFLLHSKQAPDCDMPETLAGVIRAGNVGPVALVEQQQLQEPLASAGARREVIESKPAEATVLVNPSLGENPRSPTMAMRSELKRISSLSDA